MEKTKILIVEDEAIVALYLKIQLEKRNYKVTDKLTTGEQAVTSAQKENPDIILMDVHLAGKIDGLEAALAIRNFSNSNIIFMTGYEDGDMAKAVKELKFSKILVKPVSINEILDIIEKEFKYPV
jgi:CheY-like chemotaxis protein